MKFHARIAKGRSALTAVASSIAIIASAPLVSAQDNTNVAMELNIPAEPLSGALQKVSQSFGINLIAPDDLVAGKTSGAISGALTLDGALDAALASTGLIAEQRASGAYVLSRAPVTQTDVLPEPEEPLNAKSRATDGDLPETRLELVTVQGELIERSIQDTQTSVSVVSGEELNRSVDKDLFDVIDRIPGINAEGGGFGFVIRGIPAGGVGGGSAPTVNVQVDGATLPTGQATSTGSFSTWDLEQIEVLRGPQSTQQGPSSLAGAVILKSKDPSFDGRELRLRGDYGSFNETRAAIAFNLPISDILALRFTAEDYQSDGDIVNQFTGEDSAAEFLTTYRAKARLKPNDRFDAVLSYTQSENRQGDQGVDQTVFPDQRIDDATSTTIGESDIISLDLDYSLNENWSLKSETSYLKSDYELDIPFIAANPAATPGNRTVDDTSLTSELKALYKGDQLTGVLGIYYLELEKDLDFEANIPDARRFFPPIPGLPPIQAIFANTFDTKTENIAVFGEAEYDFNENWTVIAGFRYDNEEDSGTTTNSSSFTPDPFMISADGQPATLDSEYSAFLPKGSIIYNFNEDVSLSFTAQRAYRAGGAATDITGNPYEFDPEFTNNFELAFRSITLEDRLIFNANAYLTDYTDMQVPEPGPSGTFLDSIIQNAGAATLWGIEVQSEYQLNDIVTLFGNIGYNSTEFDEYVFVEQGQPVDLSGNRFSQAPEWTGSIGADFEFGNGVFGDFSVNYTDDSFFTTRNFPEELNEPFTLVNARLGYQSDSWWTVQLYARNLFDEQYLARRRVDGFGSAGDSRVIGISLLADF